MTKTHGVTHFEPDTCFGCKASTVDFGYPHGRSFFHNSTIAERVRKENESCAEEAKRGNVFTPKGARAELI